MAGSTRSFFTRLEMSIRVPVGRDALWACLLDLDGEGPWTAGEFARRTNLNVGTPRDLVRQLRAGGYLKDVGYKLTGGKNPQEAPLYRLTKRPLQAPRLRRDGTVHPERGIERLWRAMKMAKTFTIAELAQLADGGDGAPVNRRTVGAYCNRLAAAGVLGRVPTADRETRYRLVRNLGSKAPKILETKVIFDPNANVVIGEATAREVAP